MSQLSFESLFLADQADLQPRASAPARMLSPAEARKQFASVFRQTAKNMRRSEVFSDFITLAASELDLARIRSPENIENSRRICARYQPDDLDAMKQLFCLLVEGLAGDIHDFLGALYMEQELGADEMGQYFSPSCISRLMAGLLMPGAQETIKREGWMTLDEGNIRLKGENGRVTINPEKVRRSSISTTAGPSPATAHRGPVAIMSLRLRARKTDVRHWLPVVPSTFQPHA